MAKKILLCIIAFSTIFYGIDSFSWEVFDRVIAVVNDRPIIESEVEERYRRLKRLMKMPRKKASFKRSRILDMFIEESLFIQTAEEESIIVGKKKVDHFIEKMMKKMNIKTLDDFKKKLKKHDKMTYEEYRDGLKRSMTREMVMSIVIGISPPSRKEARKFYNKNRRKMGYEVNIKHIFLRLRGRSMSAERKVNRKMRDLRNKIRRGASFESIARKYSEDHSSKSRGGALGWVQLGEIAKTDKYFAMQIFQLRRRGSVSKIIKSKRGYHLVKFLGKRTVSFETMKKMIYGILYNKRMGEQMKMWSKLKRKESAIKIFMRDYVKR